MMPSLKISFEKFISVTLLISIISISPHAVSAQSLKKKEEALKIIAEFANSFCQKVPLEGGNYGWELSGKGKVELNNILKKLIDIGVEGAVKYQDMEYKGFLQEDLVKALKESNNCRLQIWNDLKDRLLTPELQPNNNNVMAPGEYCYEYVAPERYIEEIMGQAERDANTPPHVAKVVKHSVYVGDYIKWVILCGKDYNVYERNIGDDFLRITPSANYQDNNGRKCRSVHVNTKRQNRWKSYSLNACFVNGQWKIIEN
jgi:hypothetical protein